MSRKSMDINTFDLLVRALHREYTKNPKAVDSRDPSIFFHNGAHMVHLFRRSNSDDYWITMGQVEFEYSAPGGFFKSKAKEHHKEIMKLIDEIRGRGVGEVETLICNLIPSAKEIIAEKVLVGDHCGNKASNSST